MDIEQRVDVFYNAIDYMNKWIDTRGEINLSSSIIKRWNNYSNVDWAAILDTTRILSESGELMLSNRGEQDLEILTSFFVRNSKYLDNILYPDTPTTNKLPKRLTYIGNNSVKKVTFRFMMNLRESYCDLFQIHLPNSNAVMGNYTRWKNSLKVNELFE